MDKAIFRADDHTYWLGDKQLISVTQLMAKHGLSPDYSKVNKAVLNAKAERGSFIHKEIEDYIKTAEVGFTSELQDFITEAERLGFGEMESEVIVNSDLVAGTADLIAHTKNGKVLADIKTSLTIDKEACSWQLSLYERLSGQTFSSLVVFHLGEKSKAIPITRIAAEEIDKLLEAERNGELYTKPGLIVTEELLLQAQAAEAAVKAAEAAKKQAEEVANTFREMLYNAMGEQGISSWETLDKSMLITRIEPTTRTTIDSTKLKKDLPDIAEKYSKTSDVKGSVRITLRG